MRGGLCEIVPWCDLAMDRLRLKNHVRIGTVDDGGETVGNYRMRGNEGPCASSLSYQYNKASFPLIINI